MEQHILRLPTVKAITGLSRSTIYLRMSEGSFPRQVNLGSRAVGWISSEIDNPEIHFVSFKSKRVSMSSKTSLVKR